MKLAFVVGGQSSPALLDTYEPGAPAYRLAASISRRSRDRLCEACMQAPTELQVVLRDVAMELGQLHRSQAVVGAGDDLPPASHSNDLAGQPAVGALHLQGSYTRASRGEFRRRFRVGA